LPNPEERGNNGHVHGNDDQGDDCEEEHCLDFKEDHSFDRSLASCVAGKEDHEEKGSG